MSGEAAGMFLHSMLGAGDQAPGPPYTHTWRPSIPVPFYGLLHVRCYCGRRFPGRERNASRRYEHHYRQAHAHPYTVSGGYGDPD